MRILLLESCKKIRGQFFFWTFLKMSIFEILDEMFFWVTEKIFRFFVNRCQSIFSAGS